MKFSREQLEKLHITLVEMLRFIDEFCEEEGIEYFLNCGSVLGAVRHEGFIPWDDDIDIMLPRDSYEKFCAELKKRTELPYFLQDETNETNYFCLFAKLRKKDTVFVEKDSVGAYENNGIYIDIFPLDYTDEVESFGYHLDALRIRLIKQTLRFRYCKGKYDKSRKLHYIIHFLATIPYYFRSRDYLFKTANKLMKKRNSKSKKYVVSYAGIYGMEKETFPYDVIFPAVRKSFEDSKYPICNDYDSYLKQYYGDYMKLPPEEQRHTHEPACFKF